MVEKLTVILVRQLLWFPFSRCHGLLVNSGQHDRQPFSRRRIEPIANQRLMLSIGQSPGVLRGPMKSGERRKLETIAVQPAPAATLTISGRSSSVRAASWHALSIAC
jgi:hypothetical protein